MNVQELFGDVPAEEFDTRLQLATEVLVKSAADQDIDLDMLSAEDKQAALTEIMATQFEADKVASETPAAETPVETPAVETPAVAELTHLDVTFELNKRAAEEGLDLTTLTKEQYTEVFTKVATELVEASDPELVAERQKIAEQEATFEHLGRICARGFHDELNKLAEEEEAKATPFPPKKKEEGDDEKPKSKDDEDEGEKKAMKEKLLAGAAKLVGKGRDASEAVGRKVLTTAGVKNVNKDMAHATTGVMAGVGGGTAAVLGGKEKKASYIEERAIELARERVVAAGFDPDTGDKLASDEEIAARADEILAAKGWLK